MISGWGEAEKRVQEYASYGLNISYLPKPFTMDQLKDWLTTHLGQAELT